jgi:biotin operon repressor
MLKALIPAIVMAVALGAPALASAQQSGDTVTVTRAAVKADLARMEQSGYNVEGDHTTYPAQTQAAEQRVETNGGVMATSYGPTVNGSSATGTRALVAQPQPAAARSTYFGQ